MKGGNGSAMLEIEGGIRVDALMVVDPVTVQAIAGARTRNGSRVAGDVGLLRGLAPVEVPAGENTTVGVVITNARLDKEQLAVVARRAHDGLARAVRPAHTPSDGDTTFALATGEITGDVSLLRIGILAADTTAIVRGVRAATSLPGYPSAQDLQGGVR